VDEASPTIGWVAAGAAGLVLGLGVGRFARRRPRTAPPEG
jgi:hypothetical protein